MKKWRLSNYTRIVNDTESGDLLLHNSFMGALARIPAQNKTELKRFFDAGFEKYRQLPSSEFDETEMYHPILKELCRGGFFVPTKLNERKIVNEVITAERNAGFGIIILPHENCNFRCTYCYESFERGKMKPEIVEGLKFFITQKAKEIKNLSLSWFGGEPLLAKEIIYDLSDLAIKVCEENNVSYKSGMTTNGYFLTPQVADNLISRKITHFQITLDGEESAHNKARKLISGGGTYKTIIKNLMALRDRKDDFSVTIRINFNQSTLNSMETFLEEMTVLFKNDSRFFLDFHAVGKWGGPNDSILDVCEADSAESIKFKLSEKALNRGFSDQGLKNSIMPHGSVCYAGKESSIVVGSDGTIYKCTVAFDDPRNKVGKLTKNGELIVDKKLWDLWTKMDDKDSKKCSTCSFSPSCQSRSCPLAAIQDKEPPCPYTIEGYESLVKIVGLKRVSPEINLV